MSSLAKINRVLEIFWWSMAIVTAIAVTILTIMYGWDKWGFYYIVPLLTAFMAVMRRFMSKRLTQSEAEKAKASGKK